MMHKSHFYHSSLPYYILSIGLLFSAALSYFFWQDLQDYFDFLHAIRDYLPGLSLIIGFSISILLAGIVRVAQVSRQRAIKLHHVNLNLKREINERMIAEEKRKKLEVALLQGQKLQAIGTLAGGIAHDFNNLLYAINGYISMSREDVQQDSITYKNLGKVLDATQRGQELVARILAFSRRQHHQFSLLNVSHTIDSVLGLLRPTIPASVIIEFFCIENMLILGNQTQMHQVFVNLINNAVDAMDGEGKIVINMEKLSAEDPLLKNFPDTQPTAYCKITLSDTGCGMSESTVNRIFEPFFTTKEVGKGTGLGLSIVHSIIKEHQGEIEVTSHLGTGTTFTLLLPLPTTEGEKPN